MQDASRVMVFAPSPELTVTVEDRAGVPDLHLHPGGQGVWQARVISNLDVHVSLVAGLGGETGAVLRALLSGDDVVLHAETVRACNGGYVHDRRSGERRPIAEAPGEVLGRHDLDALYETALVQGLRAGTVVLSGPTDPRTVPAELYRRLAADLTSNGCRVLADLSGETLEAALAGGLAFLKVSHEELLDDGRADSDSPKALVAAMHQLRDQGAEVVVVSRAADPALALLPDGEYEVHVPMLQQVDTRGAGDSMTGVVAAGLATGCSWPEALRVGAAAGALSVTRHGLTTGAAGSVRLLADRVRLRRWEAGR